MERQGAVTPLAVGAILLALGSSGCIHVHHTDGEKTKTEISLSGKPSTADPAATDATAKAGGKADGKVKQAGFTFPTPSFGKLTGRDKPVLPATEITVNWRNKLEFLPDPTRDGAMGTGLVGQMFLIGPNLQFTTPDGPLTIELYDETPRGGAKTEGPKLGRWRFEKDVLKTLVTPDERFGKTYALFLPWPDYRPDITRIKLTVKYEPEGGHVLYARPIVMTLDTNPSGVAPTVSHTVTTTPPSLLPPGVSSGVLNGPPTGAPGGWAPQGPAMPMNPGATTPTNPGTPPAGLPPIAITLPRR